MATGDDDNDVDGDGATGNEINVDGDGATGNEVDVDDDGGGDGTMGSSATGYNNDDNFDGRQRR